jgi:hypothetical protein
MAGENCVGKEFCIVSRGVGTFGPTGPLNFSYKKQRRKSIKCDSFMTDPLKLITIRRPWCLWSIGLVTLT